MTPSLRCAAIAMAAALLWPAVAARAEDVFIKQPAAVVRAGKGAAYEPVAELKKGDRVEVIAREGKWLKVRAGGKEGYLFESSISNEKPSGDGGLSKAMAGASGASSASSGEAGKGLGESLAWARQNRMNTRGLDRMLAMRQAVSGQDYEQFTREGNVGR